MEQRPWIKYIAALAVTCGVFATAVLISNYLSNKKIESVRDIEARIATDILSSETQFDLITSSSCRLITEDVLSNELNDLASRVSYLEGNRDKDDPELARLKRQYSLLEIKDYLLSEKLKTQCGIRSVSILYFYSNEGDCPDCEKTGTILTYLRQKYPGLRVYAFDYNLDLSAIKTIISLNKIENKLPAVVIDDKVFYSLTSLDAFEKAMPELKTLKTATTTTATSTNHN